jgi:hypothetical protein
LEAHVSPQSSKLAILRDEFIPPERAVPCAS